MDYLLKGFSDSRTLERVLRAALEHNMLGGLADLLRDPLTRLYTRDGFLTLGAVRNGNSEEEGQRPRASVHADRESGDAARKFWAQRRRALLVGSGRFDFLPLTHAFCGATNRGKTSSLVVSLLTNCKNNRE
jgi:hypothetical protein